MVRHLLCLFGPLGLLACGSDLVCGEGTHEEDGACVIDEDSDTTDTNQIDCGNTPPVIDDLSIVDGGVGDCNDGTFPRITVQLDVSDADGDLHYFGADIWYDGSIDGSVSTAGNPLHAEGPADADPCEVETGGFNITLCLDGGVPYSTQLEWGVVVYDAKENPTNGGEPQIVVFKTPDADGNYD